LLPLLPLGFQLWQSGSLDEKSLAIASSMYALSIGVSSRSKLLFGIGLFVSIAFAFVFGTLSAQVKLTTSSVWPASLSIISIFIVHAGERYNRHVAERSPFWQFFSETES